MTVELGARQLRVSSHPEETLRESQEMFPPPLPQRSCKWWLSSSGPRREGPRETRREQSEKLSNGRKSEDLQQSEKLSNGRKSEICSRATTTLDRCFTKCQTPPPPPVAAPPRLSVQKFNEETDDMAAYLDTFEAVATASEWPEAQWSINLRGSLSGAGLLAISTLNAVQQADFQIWRRPCYQFTRSQRRLAGGRCLNELSILLTQTNGCESSVKTSISG